MCEVIEHNATVWGDYLRYHHYTFDIIGFDNSLRNNNIILRAENPLVRNIHLLNSNQGKCEIVYIDWTKFIQNRLNS